MIDLNFDTLVGVDKGWEMGRVIALALFLALVCIFALIGAYTVFGWVL